MQTTKPFRQDCPIAVSTRVRGGTRHGAAARLMQRFFLFGRIFGKVGRGGGVDLGTSRFVAKMADKGTKGAITKLLNPTADPKAVSNEQWKTVLSPEEFNVTRLADTEAPFVGKFDKHFEKGQYNCLCCGAELFDSDSKYWSGCGWPAFSSSIGKDANVTRIEDKTHGMQRVEVRCKKCDAHLGHVFEDGPKETGERYCINSCSLEFNGNDKNK